MTEFKRDGSHLSYCPPVEKWDDWVEYDAEAWPRRVQKHYQLVPTICFNCESACGLLAYVDKETGQVAKFEGNPKHPSSRGRLCAKGPATINQIHDPDRILYPMKRSGPRGGGFLNGRGTNLFHAFRLCPPGVPTEPVSTWSSIKARAGCHPPRLPDALPRQRCDAKRLPAAAISRDVLTMTSAFTPLSFSANSGVYFA